MPLPPVRREGIMFASHQSSCPSVCCPSMHLSINTYFARRDISLLSWQILYDSHVADYATSPVQQCNTRRTPCIPALLTSVGAQRRRQTDTSIFSVWAHHTNAARPSLAAVSGTHRF